MNRGAAAEALAARFLMARGLSIVGRNYRCRGGEIDLIVRDGKTLVFVEVRLRRSQAF
ncbi:MAG: YraN family protein, partial [Betaproteobacteria bacterium]